ncbi:MAG: antitoxin family protein [Planctomycetia bacterium]|nr:antitoxin family protein [Planctomycetia bacterium]
MARTIRARFSHGVIEPLEKVEMPEGKEITITISETLTKEFLYEEEQRDREWGNLAMSSFASDWNNEKDAIYDNWKDLYHVQKR